jgi:hypothetical protein
MHIFKAKTLDHIFGIKRKIIFIWLLWNVPIKLNEFRRKCGLKKLFRTGQRGATTRKREEDKVSHFIYAQSQTSA